MGLCGWALAPDSYRVAVLRRRKIFHTYAAGSTAKHKSGVRFGYEKGVKKNCFTILDDYFKNLKRTGHRHYTTATIFQLAIDARSRNHN
jgi:hypothetical protein